MAVSRCPVLPSQAAEKPPAVGFAPECILDCFERMIPCQRQEATRATEFARRYLETTGRRLVINPIQHQYFMAAGLDMSLFEVAVMLPRI